MNEFELNAELREDVGKGASRRLRRSGKLPGILYGADKETAAITLDHDDVVHQLEHEAFYSHILTLSLGKEKQKVVLKDLQRHPFKPHLLHIDLQRIDEAEELTMRVPIHFINEAKCVGVKTGGGVISHLMSEIEVVCLPKDLPEFIEVDMENINVGDTVHLNEINMPEGVVSYIIEHGGNPETPIASVHIPKIIEEEEEVPEEALAEGIAPVAEGAEETTEKKEEEKPSEED